MRVWLVTVGEPLPSLSFGSRPWRTGVLAAELARRGHEVTWWTSRFDHFTKEYFATDLQEVSVERNLTLVLLDGLPYRKNVSFARLRNHWQVARRFASEQSSRRRPDVIACSFPTIELSWQAVKLGVREQIPVAIDVRDLWPDIFLDVGPRGLRWLPRLLLDPYFRAAREVMSAATSLIGVSEGYLQWALSQASRPRRPTDRVIPLAYSLPADSRPTREEGLALLRQLGGTPGATTCIFSGTFGRTYDLGPVLSVAPRFRGGAKSLQFVLCGDGERRNEWRSRAAGIGNVIFTGWLDQDRMRKMLAASDIGLAAYAKGAPQGIPNKVIEYLAAGLPVASALRGETEALLRDEGCGETYDPDDVNSLQHVLTSLADERHGERSAIALELFGKRFRAEAVYGAYADHLEALAKLMNGHAVGGLHAVGRAV